MLATALSAPPPSPDTGHADMLDQVRRIASERLRPLAREIDEGHYPLEIMAALGEAGALKPHLARHGGRVDLAIEANAAVSRHCGSTGFLMWCHHVCGLYLEASPNPALSQGLLGEHEVGRAFGGTGLSNPMKALAGIEPFLLKARKVAGGYRVNGALPWVSHIAPGQHFGAMALVEAEGGEPAYPMLFFIRCDRVELRPCPRFSGMEGTSTWGVRFADIFVPEGDVIAAPAGPFVKQIRASFILLQTGMAIGITQGAIDDIRDVQPQLGHVNGFLADQAGELAAELAELEATALSLARNPGDDTDHVIDILDARARGSDLVLRATQAALMHQGARGYLHSAAPQRRIREAHFVAIVTPAIKHLRWEMQRLLREEMPA